MMLEASPFLSSMCVGGSVRALLLLLLDFRDKPKTNCFHVALHWVLATSIKLAR